MAKRNETQWQRVAMYTPCYMGYSEKAENAFFIPADRADIVDGLGWDVDGNSAGSYSVWPSFAAFKRQYPGASFTDSGYIDIGEQYQELMMYDPLVTATTVIMFAVVRTTVHGNAVWYDFSNDTWGHMPTHTSNSHKAYAIAAHNSAMVVAVDVMGVNARYVQN